VRHQPAKPVETPCPTHRLARVLVEGVGEVRAPALCCP
jgi:hypothetical protein